MDFMPPCSEQTWTYFGWEQLNNNSTAAKIAPKIPVNATAEIIKALLFCRLPALNYGSCQRRRF